MTNLTVHHEKAVPTVLHLVSHQGLSGIWWTSRNRSRWSSMEPIQHSFQSLTLDIFCLDPSAFFSGECQKKKKKKKKKNPPHISLIIQEGEVDLIQKVYYGCTGTCTWHVRLGDSNGELVASSLLNCLNFLFLYMLVSFWVRLFSCDRKMATNSCNLYVYNDSLRKPLFLSIT